MSGILSWAIPAAAAVGLLAGAAVPQSDPPALVAAVAVAQPVVA